MSLDNEVHFELHDDDGVLVARRGDGLSRVFAPKRDITLWGTQGGRLGRYAQTHAAIIGNGFYFTLAVRGFGRWARTRITSRRPFVWLGHGRMHGSR